MNKTNFMSSGGERSTEEKPIEFHCRGFEKMNKKTQNAIVEMVKCAAQAMKDGTLPRNDVHSKDFESKIDDYFTSKTKVKDSGRKCSIKIFGQWT